MIAIKVCNSNITILVVHIYLPLSNHSLAEYKDEVDTLYDLLRLEYRKDIIITNVALFLKVMIFKCAKLIMLYSLSLFEPTGQNILFL